MSFNEYREVLVVKKKESIKDKTEIFFEPQIVTY